MTAPSERRWGPLGSVPVETDASEAARDSVDLGRLLDGEDPTSDRQDEAELWMTVYRELVAFKEDLVTRTETTARAMLPEAAQEVQTTDLVVLRAEYERLRRRLDFWTRRHEQLAGG